MAGITPAPLHWFRRMLKARGETVESLAAQIGRGRSHLSQVLNGHRPGGHTWGRIRAVVTPDEWAELLKMEHCATWNTAHPAPISTMQPNNTEPTLSRARVAEILGVSWDEVQGLEPEGFGIPRHRRWTGTADVYTEEGVTVLVQVLRDRGAIEGADHLAAEWQRVRDAARPWWARFADGGEAA